MTVFLQKNEFYRFRDIQLFQNVRIQVVLGHHVKQLVMVEIDRDVLMVYNTVYTIYYRMYIKYNRQTKRTKARWPKECVRYNISFTMFDYAQ